MPIASLSGNNLFAQQVCRIDTQARLTGPATDESPVRKLPMLRSADEDIHRRAGSDPTVMESPKVVSWVWADRQKALKAIADESQATGTHTY